VARIAGVDLPADKRIDIALTYIFGIGRSTARRILQDIGLDASLRAKTLTDEQTAKLRQVIENEYKVEGSLRAEVSQNIKRLMDIGTYRGLRHRKNLPVRGQRSRTNARTRKGPKKGSGMIKRAAAPVKK
jgi:small subunit ribosomal protein S13